MLFKLLKLATTIKGAATLVVAAFLLIIYILENGNEGTIKFDHLRVLFDLIGQSQ